VHLKSLTLRGFKSFASATTLRFEPGITCVVGPNGSGKSNVVDAISWVLGEQGAKSLRGGKMEDVVFAGTSARPPLGRAEVELTIDNTDGALPIDFAEVTISRLMFRSGESEYAINGSPCRLLDVQELLSDSGIGRELHVIVGQGQLDAVLTARPEDRRAFIEEAAGVLKHRKRKEKALRKLEGMQAGLTRLEDLTAEMRRQLKPLGRQAEVARRAAVIQAELRDARLRLLADDVATLTAALDRELADEAEIRRQRAVVEAELASLGERETRLESEIAAASPRLARAQDTWYRLAALAERFRGLRSLAVERQRQQDFASAQITGPDPDALEHEAEQSAAERDVQRGVLEEARERLATATRQRQEAELRLAAEEERLVRAVRAVADRREGLARLSGEVAALRSRAAAADAEMGRLTAALAAAEQRAREAEVEFRSREADIAGLSQGESDLDRRHEAAARALQETSAHVAALEEEEQAAERQRSALQGRRDALALAMQRGDGGAALMAAGDRVPGLRGAAAGLLDVTPGDEVAIAAALGAAADALAVDSWDGALAALRLLKDENAGRAALLVATAEPPPTSGPDHPAPGATGAGLPRGARWALDCVRVPAAHRRGLASLLRDVVVVADLDLARRVVTERPHLTAVTGDGDVVATGWVAGGSRPVLSRLEVQAAVEDTDAELGDCTRRCEELRRELAAAREERDRRAEAVRAALADLHASDAELAAVAEQLGRLGAAVRAAGEEADRLRRALEQAAHDRDRDLAGLSELQRRLGAAEEEPGGAEPSTEERAELSRRCSEARAVEVEARLVVRTAEERLRTLAERTEALTQAAARERASREAAARARARRAEEVRIAGAVQQAAAEAIARLEASMAAAADARAAADRDRTVREGELLTVRARARELAGRLEKLTDAVHRDEVVRAEQRARIDGLRMKGVEEYGVEPAALLAEYGPDVAVPVTADPGQPLPGETVAAEPEAGQPRAGEPAATGPVRTVPYNRTEQARRARAAERSLDLLGKVNPLALEEYAALQDRQRFLAEQLEDLRATRRDLLALVREVDERVEQIFAAAFADTAREFAEVFGILFPGGEGRLVPTDPDNMLLSGVEVEARPAGKRLRRLSLLSGGERALTAIALLVAIFRARPSPFYVLDEVEAALDDRNLGRLVGLLRDLSRSSQLIVVTHQRRTMEAGDALYGVSMRGDGISEVVSQRLRERETA
jgi:chromosome segregation protein